MQYFLQEISVEFAFLSQVLTILYLLRRLMFLMHLLIFFDKLGMSLRALEDLVIHPGLCFHVLLYSFCSYLKCFWRLGILLSRHWRLSQWVTLRMKNEGFLGCKAYVCETGQEVLISILKWVFFYGLVQPITHITTGGAQGCQVTK